MSENYSEIKKQKEDNLVVGVKGGTIAFALQILATALGFLNTIILARILGASGIGEVLLALTVVNISVLLAGFGMQGAMMRFVPFYNEIGETAKLKGTIYFVLRFCFLLSIVFVVVILIFSKFISINIFHSSVLLKLLPIAAVAVPANVINDVICGILKGYKDAFRALLPHSVITPFFRIIIFLLLSLISISSLYAIIAFIVGETIAVILSIMFLLKKVDRVKPVYQRSEYKRVLDVSSTMILTTFSWFLYTQADIWIVGMFTSTESVGIYGVVARLVTLIAFSLGAFSAIIPPIMSSVYTSGDRSELQRVVRESTRWALSIAIPIGLIFLLEGNYILKYAYGEKFAAGYMSLVILSVGQIINVGSGLVGWLLQMTGGHKIFMKINILWGVLNVILNVILVPRLGIVGAALSTAFCLSMVNIVSVFVIYKKLSLLTLAKGLKFDVIFSIAVACLYFLISFKNYYMGHHLLLIAALIIYIWKSLIKGDLPLKYLLPRYRT